jgi:hypothetical protein
MQNGKHPERYCRGVKLDVVRDTTNQQNASTSLTLSNEATPGMDASPEVI